LPFLEFGEAVEQGLASDEPEHGISQKLEILVIATRRTGARRTTGSAQRLQFARLRAVSKRLLEQFVALEAVTQAFFQRHDFACLHHKAGPWPFRPNLVETRVAASPLPRA
jgi:hypothetical protein